MRINGWVFVDKPEGILRKVVDLVSNSLSIKKVGHAGTLDPMVRIVAHSYWRSNKDYRVIQQFKTL